MHYVIINILPNEEPLSTSERKFSEQFYKKLLTKIEGDIALHIKVIRQKEKTPFEQFLEEELEKFHPRFRTRTYGNFKDEMRRILSDLCMTDIWNYLANNENTLSILFVQKERIITLFNDLEKKGVIPLNKKNTLLFRRKEFTFESYLYYYENTKNT